MDLRKIGSGNIGAVNSFRALGILSGVLTLLIDFLKGFLIVFYSSGFPSDVHSVIALSTVAGHDYSIFLRFKGGKGVATTLGIVTALNWKITLILLIPFAIFVLGYRISSLGSIVACAILPLIVYFWEPNYFLLALILALLAILRHRPNIERLIQGRELPIALRKKEDGF